MPIYAPVFLHSYAFLHINDGDDRVEVKRDLWRSSGPPPLLKQGHLQQAAQDHVQMAFGYLQGHRLHYLVGRPLLSAP